MRKIHYPVIYRRAWLGLLDRGSMRVWMALESLFFLINPSTPALLWLSLLLPLRALFLFREDLAAASLPHTNLSSFICLLSF